MEKTTHPLTAYRHAFGLSQEALGEKLGVLAPAISKWESRTGPKFVPADRVIDVARVTNIPPYLLRPDLYPADAFSLAKAGG